MIGLIVAIVLTGLIVIGLSLVMTIIICATSPKCLLHHCLLRRRRYFQNYCPECDKQRESKGEKP